MAKIDYKALQHRIPILRVLEELGWKCVSIERGWHRGRCLTKGVHRNDRRALGVEGAVAYCYRCCKSWDGVALWALVNGMSMGAAAQALCDHFGVALPVISRVAPCWSRGHQEGRRNSHER